MAFDLGSAATNATKTANSAISNSGVVAGLQSAGKALDVAKNAAASGVSNIAGGIVNAIPGQLKGAFEKVPKILDLDIAGLINSAKAIVNIPGTPPFPNVLHNYASYNYLWTLSVLTPQDLNFPDDSYRKGKVGQIILKSGSGDPENRISTPFRSSSNPTGKFDYYIDNVRVSGMMGFDKTTGNTNATGISFDVFEPYSMGLFFQSLQIAALEANYVNYLDCPLLLKLEFKGHIDQFKQNVQIPGTTKYFPMKIRNITMRVNATGSSYSCEAIPWNEKAHNTTYSQIKTEINISGSTVQEMIQKGEKSLQKVVNDRYLEAMKRKDVEIPDQILILFPTDLKTGDATGVSDDSSKPSSATVNPNDSQANKNVYKRLGVVRGSDGFNLVQNDSVNPIGISSMGFNEYRKGDPAFAKDNAVYDEKTGTYKRGNITISKTSSEARFAQGTDIPNVINQIILSSDYGRQALDPDKISPDGFVNWWRIDTQVYVLDSDDNMGKTGRKPNLVVYRVTPFKVHHSKFMAPNESAKGVEQIKLQAIKEYNYLYTSKNLDILNFNIEFNSAFYTTLTADSGKNNQSVQRVAETGRAAVDNKGDNNKGSTANNLVRDTAGALSGANSGIQIGSVVTRAENDTIKTRSGGKGGPSSDDPGTIAARQFHDAITEGADMVELDMEILGDPYYLGDSGMGNYSAQATNLSGLNADGGINYQDGNVYINVKFRNPIDINMNTGRYDFDGKLVPQFSGLYMVTKVENMFKGGKFTQTLSLNRMVGQDVKDTGSPVGTLVSKIADSFNPNNPSSYAVSGSEGE